MPGSESLFDSSYHWCIHKMPLGAEWQCPKEEESKNLASRLISKDFQGRKRRKERGREGQLIMLGTIKSSKSSNCIKQIKSKISETRTKASVDSANLGTILLQAKE
jgi:hypothetical protein